MFEAKAPPVDVKKPPLLYRTYAECWVNVSPHEKDFADLISIENKDLFGYEENEDIVLFRDNRIKKTSFMSSFSQLSSSPSDTSPLMMMFVVFYKRRRW